MKVLQQQQYNALLYLSLIYMRWVYFRENTQNMVSNLSIIYWVINFISEYEHNTKYIYINLQRIYLISVLLIFKYIWSSMTFTSIQIYTVTFTFTRFNASYVLYNKI